jgi:hypothetical protein
LSVSQKRSFCNVTNGAAIRPDTVA